MKIQKLGKNGAVIITPEAGYMLTRYDEETTDILYYAGYSRVMCSESQIVLYREITIAQHLAYMQAKDVAEEEAKEETGENN